MINPAHVKALKGHKTDAKERSGCWTCMSAG